MCLSLPQILLDMYSQDLDDAKMILDHQVAHSKTPLGPVLNKNMPQVAGSLIWSQQLRERVANGMEKLRTLDKEYVLYIHTCTIFLPRFVSVSACRITTLSDAERVFTKYDEIMDLLERFVIK